MDCVRNVWSGARREVHTFPNEGAERKTVSDRLFGVVLGAHVTREASARAGCFYGIGMFHAKVTENSRNKLALVNHK